jgi:ankyrin repeat protein
LVSAKIKGLPQIHLHVVGNQGKEQFLIGENEETIIKALNVLADYVEKNYGSVVLRSFLNSQDKNGVTPLHIAA